MKTLGIDPGTSNFAVVSIEGLRVRKAYMLGHTIKDLKTPGAARKQMAKFASNMWPMLLEHDHVVCERYMNRGVRSATGEFVNIMLGNLLTRKDMLLLPAVTWKNAANRRFNLKQAYKAFSGPAHLLDALLLALYNKDKTYATLTYKQLTKFMVQIEVLQQELCRNIKNHTEQLRLLQLSFVQ